MLDITISVKADNSLAAEQAITFIVEQIHAGRLFGESETHDAVTEWSTVSPDEFIEDSDYPLSDWAYETRNGDTRLGYVDWLKQKKEN